MTISKVICSWNSVALLPKACSKSYISEFPVTYKSLASWITSAWNAPLLSKSPYGLCKISFESIYTRKQFKTGKHWEGTTLLADLPHQLAVDIMSILRLLMLRGQASFFCGLIASTEWIIHSLGHTVDFCKSWKNIKYIPSIQWGHNISAKLI